MSIVLAFIRVNHEATREQTLTTQFSFGLLTGDGLAAGGRVLPLLLRTGLALAFDGGRFEFRFVALFEFPLLAFLFVADRLLFALRFPAFALSFAFLFVFLLRLGRFSFAEVESFVFLLSPFSVGVGSGAGVNEDSPSFTGRLISIATVWPAFTTSPARGN